MSSLSRKGLRVDDKKIERVKNWPRPKTVKEVRAFMGFVNYYRRFIKNLSIIANPLYALTKKENETFIWKQEQEDAFLKIKEKLCSTEVMKFPDFNKPFRLTTDASKIGYGAILEQEDDNGEIRPVAFASKTLPEEATRYTTTELELGAMRWAARHYKYYLLGKREFEIYTDHQALAGKLKSSEHQSTRINNYLQDLSPYNFVIKYVPGKVNQAADKLSRKEPIPKKTKIKAD